MTAWNRAHPHDQRTILRFCSEACIFRAGQRLGAMTLAPMTLAPDA